MELCNNHGLDVILIVLSVSALAVTLAIGTVIVRHRRVRVQYKYFQGHLGGYRVR